MEAAEALEVEMLNEWIRLEKEDNELSHLETQLKIEQDYFKVWQSIHEERIMSQLEEIGATKELDFHDRYEDILTERYNAEIYRLWEIVCETIGIEEKSDDLPF